jgi:hypothetical protein
MSVKVSVKESDALTFEADVLALKYAQNLYGVDAAVCNVLSEVYKDIYDNLPDINQGKLIRSAGKLGVNEVLFIGVVSLYQFRYQEIREFARKVLTFLSLNAPKTKHLCLTLHGMGYGLDESEAFESEIAGLVDAIRNGEFPKYLEQITIVEYRTDRAHRLRKILSDLLPKGSIVHGLEDFLKEVSEVASEKLRSVGYASGSKPNIFVAMPFADDMEDVFHYGIQGAVNAEGFLCERADLSSFTGDIMEWVKKRIRESSLVIADLTHANPNVYLEVGYAWGCGKPTVLLVQDTDHLKFDVRGQRCLTYHKIKELEEILRRELKKLKTEML